jgi:hypothetical protein
MSELTPPLSTAMQLRRRLRIGPDQFATLLCFLLVSLLISGVSTRPWTTVVGAAANLGALLAGFAASGMWSNRRRMGILFAIGLLGSVAVGTFSQTSVAAGVGALGQALVLGAVLVAVVGRVVSHQEVGAGTILGAIAAYFLIGTVFSWLYLASYGLFDPPILDPDVQGLPTYYSFVVLSTLGFGDITPVHPFVERLTAIEAVTGQIFLATLVARLVSVYRPARDR